MPEIWTARVHQHTNSRRMIPSTPYRLWTLDLGHWTNFLRVSPFSTLPLSAPASSAFQPATETPLVLNPADTVRKRVSRDSGRHPSVCAPASHQSAHRDPRYTRHASSGESQASKLRARDFPLPGC